MISPSTSMSNGAYAVPVIVWNSGRDEYRSIANRDE